MATAKKIADIIMGIVTLFWILLSISSPAHNVGGDIGQEPGYRHVFFPMMIVLYAVGRVLFMKPTEIGSSDIHPRVHTKEVEGDYIGSITIPGDDTDYELCCYQTSRLGERYCICGRAIPDKLMQYFEDRSDLNPQHKLK